jgi:outer membrane protein assembly factor BamC
VPDLNPQGSATLSTYNAERGGAVRAGSTELLPIVAKVRIERAGTQRWLVVPETPEKVWPVVKEFWQGLGFAVKTELPEAGVMETDWAENRAKIPEDGLRNLLGKVLDSVYSTGERDKFRTRLSAVPSRLDRDLHQPSRHGRGLQDGGQGHDRVATPSRGFRAGSGIPAPADGAFWGRGRAREVATGKQ